MPDFRIEQGLETSIDASLEKIEAWKLRPEIEPRLKLEVFHSCRVRPFLSHETQEKQEATKIASGLRYIDPALPLEDSLCADFDKVFDVEATNKDVFETYGRAACDKMLAGENTVLIAYGQAGAGKTRTILEDDGLVPKSLDYILRQRVRLEASACEIFGNSDLIRCMDVLSGGKRCEILDEAKAKKIDNAHFAEEFLEEVKKQLHFAKTATGEKSSRGHVIYHLKTEAGWLVIVDLAGCDGQTALEKRGWSIFEGPKAEIENRFNELQCIDTGLKELNNEFWLMSQIGKINKSKIITSKSDLVQILKPKLEQCCSLFMLYHLDPISSMNSGSRKTLDFASNVVKCSGIDEGMVRKTQLNLAKSYRGQIEADRMRLEKENDELEVKLSEVNGAIDLAADMQHTIEVDIETKMKLVELASSEQTTLEKELERVSKGAQDAVDGLEDLEKMHKTDLEKIAKFSEENQKWREDTVVMKERLRKEKENVKNNLATAKTKEINLNLENEHEKKEFHKLKHWNCAGCTYRAPKKKFDTSNT